VIIETERLRLRPLTIDDAPKVRQFLDDPKVAAELPSVPHPLPEGGAEEWIRSSSSDLMFAVVGRQTGAFGGVIGLHLEEGNRAQLGGFCAKPYRLNGYAAEALHAVVRYGYEELGLGTIYALRKGRLWIAPVDFAEQRLPFRNAPDSWSVLEQTDDVDDAARNPVARPGERIGRIFRRRLARSRRARE
jgi:hypothetical protein